MSGPSCHNCIYSVYDPELWLRRMWLGEPVLPTCANHPQWPAQLHEVPGVPCRNYRRKPTVPQGDVRLIPLVDGLYAYVDAADYEWLSQWSWHVASAGYAARSSGRAGTIFMHREIMQPPKGMVVDHQDGNKANNCRFNLRVCTPQENRRNVPRQNRGRSGFKGVYYDKYGRVFTRITFEGKAHYLGYFPTEVEAARAYDRAAVEAFGKFARLNFPQEWPPERRRRVYTQSARRGGPSFARKPVSPRRAKARTIKTKERKKDTCKTKARCARRGESSFARTPTSPQGKRMRRKQRKRDMRKPKANKKAKTNRKPHPTRRKTNKLPQRVQRGLRPQPNRS